MKRKTKTNEQVRACESFFYSFCVGDLKQRSCVAADVCQLFAFVVCPIASCPRLSLSLRQCVCVYICVCGRVSE